MANARRPRAAVYINGQLASGLLECTVDSNSYAQADTFTALFAVDELFAHDWTEAFGANGIDGLLRCPQILVSVIFTSDRDRDPDGIEAIRARVDDIFYDPVNGSIELSGRDATGYFIDSKTTDKWANKTVAQVVTELAARHGLVPVITGNPNKLVGSFLSDYTARIGDSKTEWDLLRFLAQNNIASDGDTFVVYVSGSSLFFGPRPFVPAYSLECLPPARPGEPYTVIPAQCSLGPEWGVDSLTFSRNITVAKDISVTVRSRQRDSTKVISAVFPKQAKGATPGHAGGTGINILKSFPGLTKEECLQRAQAIQKEMSRHELKMVCRLPGDTVLLPTMSIQVSGTGTVFDQDYYVSSINRSYNPGDGFTMEFSAKNIAQESEVAL